LCDIAGGMPSTLPYEADIVSEELKPFMEKYLKRNTSIPIEDQIKFWMFFSDMTISGLGGLLNYAGFHGGGSPIMEQIAITSQYDINLRKKVVKNLAGITSNKENEV